MNAAEIEVGVYVLGLLRDHLLQMRDRLAAAAETGEGLAERMTRARVARRRRHDQLQQRKSARGIAILDQEDGQQQARVVVLAAARQNLLARCARGRAVALIVVADRV